MEGIRKLSKKRILDNKDVGINASIFIALVCISFFMGKRNYLLFHTGIEIYTSIIAYNILIISLNAHNASHTRSVILLGVAYGFIGAFNILHVITYEGIGVFSYTDTSISNQLWLVARYFEASTLLIFVMFYNRKFKLIILEFIYGILSIISVLVIFYWDIFSIYLGKYLRLTSFKMINEYSISLILLLTIYLLHKNRKKLSFINYEVVMLAIVLTLTSEVFLTLHIKVNDLNNIMSHILKLLSFYLLFRSVNAFYITKPQKTLARENNQLRLETVKYQKDNRKLKEEINNRKLRETQSISNQKKLESILESVEEGIVLVSINSKKKALHWNDKFLKIWDIGEEIIQEGDIDKMLLYVKDQLKNPEDFMVEANEMYNNKERTCHILEFKDGRVLERYSNPLVINGEVLGKVLSFRDITERKNTEAIRKENEFNKRLLNEEREYDELRTKFFTNLSHELKTPINVLLGNVQLLKLYLDNNSMDENISKITKHLNSMWQNCYRLLRLVNNLTDIVKIDSGYFDITLKNNNIVSVVEKITFSVADYIENMGINFVFDTNSEEKILACDPDKIERILLNLLSNAVKFTDRGGKISVKVNVLKDKVSLSVEDTGIGIPIDKQSTIFDRFKKVNEDLVRNYQGTGIGLSLVKSLVEMHDGTISLKSNFGDGSKFIIEIPSKLVSQMNEEPIKGYMENHDNNIEKLNIEFSDIYS